MPARILSALTLVLICASLSLAQTTASDYYSRAISKIATQDFDGAIADLTKAIALNYPSLGDAYLARGVAKTRKMDLNGACRNAETTLSTARSRGE